MRTYFISWRSVTTIIRQKRMGWFAVLSLLALLLTGCSFSNIMGTEPAPTPAPVRVNGFGTAANHVHSMLALPNKVLVLATHYGLFRSSDNGATWKLVAAGPNQLMDGLMTYSLVSSSLDQQRLFVLAQPTTGSSKGIVGLYTSADQGRTWQLGTAASAITSGTIYLAQAGNDTPDQVYVYLPNLGPLGLKMSMDAGQHFTETGTLPFGSLACLLAIPDAPGHLLACSSDGIARSMDGGAHWELVKGISGGVFEMVTPGPKSVIYANGDSGIYASNDGGATFTLVNSQASYGSLSVSAAQPKVVYGRTGVGIYRSSDGGHTWNTLPPIKGNLGNIAVDPTNASQIYLSLSYPTAVYQFNPNSSGWSSLTPKS